MKKLHNFSRRLLFVYICYSFDNICVFLQGEIVNFNDYTEPYTQSCIENIFSRFPRFQTFCLFKRKKTKMILNQNTFVCRGCREDRNIDRLVILKHVQKQFQVGISIFLVIFNFC